MIVFLGTPGGRYEEEHDANAALVSEHFERSWAISCSQGRDTTTISTRADVRASGSNAFNQIVPWHQNNMQSFNVQSLGNFFLILLPRVLCYARCP